MNEKIYCAANRVVQPIFLGPHHGACFVAMKNSVEQGFITTEGRFVDRIEGLVIAVQEGQITTKHRPFDVLLSEDLK